MVDLSYNGEREIPPIITPHEPKERVSIMANLYMTQFIANYMDTALWASVGDDGEPLDKTFSLRDIAPDATKTIKSDCYDFVAQNWKDLANLNPAQTGHDFFLTRNGHGAGFWDRGLGDVGDRLTKAAEAYGDSGFYAGDDGKIHVL